MSWADWDPGDYKTEDLPSLLRPLHRFYLWASPQTTGHAAHAMNAVLVLTLLWLVLLGPRWSGWLEWLFYAWPAAILFYGWREWPYSTTDNRLDVAYVIAIALALYLPAGPLYWIVPVWVAATFLADLRVWLGEPPPWMPKDKILPIFAYPWRGNR